MELRDWRDWLFVGVAVMVVAIYYNSVEAHRHSHEAAF